MSNWRSILAFDDTRDTAREMVGDGKLPNLYWVSMSSQFYTNKGNARNSFDWSGEVYENFPDRFKMFGPFETFHEAKDKLHDLRLEHCRIEPEEPWPYYYTVEIEDRFTGTLYSEGWLEHYPNSSWEVQDDTKYTRKAMEELGAEFV